MKTNILIYSLIEICSIALVMSMCKTQQISVPCNTVTNTALKLRNGSGNISEQSLYSLVCCRALTEHNRTECYYSQDVIQRHMGKHE